MNNQTMQRTALPTLMLHNWSQPNALVGSGFDIRSSENALLSLFYGSLEHAAQFDWTNGGRTLVDKTYIHILWQAKTLPSIGMSHHDIAPNIERFVRNYLQPQWPQLTQPINSDNASAKAVLAADLVAAAAQQLFGSSYQEQAASWLLFYLCPHLPIYPVYPTLLLATGTHDYRAYSYHCSALLTDLTSNITQLAGNIPQPAAHYGSEKEQVLIDNLFGECDWWQRYCLTEQLLLH